MDEVVIHQVMNANAKHAQNYIGPECIIQIIHVKIVVHKNVCDEFRKRPRAPLINSESRSPIKRSQSFGSDDNGRFRCKNTDKNVQ